MPHYIAKGLAWVFMVYSLIIGGYYLYAPVHAAKASGLDLRSMQHGIGLDISFVQMFAGRNLAVSFMLGVFTIQRRYTTVGTIMLCLVYGALTDALVTYNHGMEGSWTMHVAGAFVLATLGIVLVL